jgi:nicotinamidase-related amidase
VGHPRLLRRESTALLFVDVQERLHREVARKEAVASAAVKLAEAAKILGVPVILAEHAAKNFGATIEPLRAALAGYAPLHKMSFSCFGSDEFRAKLAALGKTQILAAGLETHICLCQTVLDAIDAGYQTHVARDASSARTEESHAAGLEKMAGAGAIPATAESAIYELLGKAGTDEFRAILPIIKRP